MKYVQREIIIQRKMSGGDSMGWGGVGGGGGRGDFQRELFRGNCPWNKSLVSNCPRGQLLRGKCADTLKNIS